MKPVIFFLSALFFPLPAPDQLLDNFDDGDFSGHPAWQGDTGPFPFAGGALTGGLRISEIMADPSPPTGLLPEAEYVEIYNDSDQAVDLSAVSIRIGEKTRMLPHSLLPPGVYAILCDEADADALSGFGTAIPVAAFPGLPNSGEEISLIGQEGDTIDRAAYHPNWYGDPLKEDGGWSLERRSLRAPAYCAHNWQASADPGGGTPGKANSAADAPPENNPPALLRASPESLQEIVLFFDEQLDEQRAADVALYSIDNGVGVSQAFPQAPHFREVLLLLDSPLSEGVRYTVHVASSLPDCLGNETGSPQQVTFGLPSPMAPGDLIINEILPHPQSGGADFVELYNRSGKILDLDGLFLINTRKNSGNVSASVKSLFLVFPGEYVVLTNDPGDIRLRYEVRNPAALLENELPTLEAGEGNLTIRQNNITIDSFDYSDAMHFPLLTATRGVSLERISPEAATQDIGNWHSAASTAGFGTPTAKNSQHQPLSSAGEALFRLAHPSFSPDGDGFEDVLLIEYRGGQPGYVLNLRVFDAQGRLVRILASNALLAQSSLFQWDGITGDGTKARIGPYILWFELYHPGGEVIYQKETCVLAGLLDN